ncbi:hypothetical protein IAR55_001309 [Kwoniella newhampshirensis]|uniref:Uncharacterized protein n=1 Tax=Kwoniella newhampshirensis TaxID=1651941 RepID=A0AAW0Z5B0_9TREE
MTTTRPIFAPDWIFAGYQASAQPFPATRGSSGVDSHDERMSSTTALDSDSVPPRSNYQLAQSLGFSDALGSSWLQSIVYPLISSSSSRSGRRSIVPDLSPSHADPIIVSSSSNQGVSDHHLPSTSCPATPHSSTPLLYPSSTSISTILPTTTSTGTAIPLLPPSYTSSSPPDYKPLPSSSDLTILLAPPPSFFQATCPRSSLSRSARAQGRASPVLPEHSCPHCFQPHVAEDVQNRNGGNRNGSDWIVRILVILNIIVWGAVIWGYYCELTGTQISWDQWGSDWGKGAGIGMGIGTWNVNEISKTGREGAKRAGLGYGRKCGGSWEENCSWAFVDR